VILLKYKLRAKTGSIGDSTSYMGCGMLCWIEKNNNAYFFATNFEAKSDYESVPFTKRKEITLAIFKELGIIE